MKFIEKPILNGLVRDQPRTPEGKYLVKRRDGSVVEWPSFVLGARDPAAPFALRAYASCAETLGMSQGYVDAVRRLAGEFEDYCREHREGDPDRGTHRKDDPATVEEMKRGRSS